MRAPTPGPLQNWRIDPNAVEIYEDFVAEVMRHWDLKRDTTEIAQLTFESEAAVSRALWIGREKRRKGQ